MSETSVIRIENVTKIYGEGENEVRALRGVDLTVQPGELVAIMGSSGSGKSTLMNILGCLDVPTGGSYLLDGIRVDGMGKNELADLRNQKLGFVFQGFNLLARTSALENVELPLLYDRKGRWKDTRAMAAEALERVGLGKRLDHHPSQLSGGQQQRVAVARAIALDPPLILADEPTAHLDFIQVEEVLRLIRGLADGDRVVVVATHDSRILPIADHVVDLGPGAVDAADLGRLTAGEDPRSIQQSMMDDVASFIKRRTPYLLYR